MSCYKEASISRNINAQTLSVLAFQAVIAAHATQLILPMRMPAKNSFVVVVAFAMATAQREIKYRAVLFFERLDFHPRGPGNRHMPAVLCHALEIDRFVDDRNFPFFGAKPARRKSINDG